MSNCELVRIQQMGRFGAFLGLAQANESNYSAQVAERAVRAANWYAPGISNVLRAPEGFKGVSRFRNAVFRAIGEGPSNDIRTIAVYPCHDRLLELGLGIPGRDMVSKLAKARVISKESARAFEKSSRTFFGSHVFALQGVKFLLDILERPLVRLSAYDHEKFVWSTGFRIGDHNQKRQALDIARRKDMGLEESKASMRTSLNSRTIIDQAMLERLDREFRERKPLTVHPRYLFDGWMLGKGIGAENIQAVEEALGNVEISPDLRERMLHLVIGRDMLIAQINHLPI